MEPPPDQQSTRHNHFCSRCQDGRRRHQGWRQKPQELGGVGGESFKVAPCHPGDAKGAPQAEAIGNRGEEREGQGHAKQPDRETAKLRLVEHGSSPRADYFFGSGIVICLASRGCRTTARTRVLPFLLGFLDTRCRQPVGSYKVSPAFSVLAGLSSMLQP